MHEFFPEIPEDLSALDDDQLAELRDTLANRIREFGAAALAGDADVIGELTTVQAEEALADAVTALKTVDADIADRATEASTHESRIAELAAEAGVTLSAEETPAEGETGTDGDADGDSDDGESTDDAGDTDAQTASATATPARRPLPIARARHKAVATDIDSSGLRLTSQAAALGAPFEAQSQLGRREIGETLTELINRRVRPGERVVVASATYDYPEDRVLSQKEGETNAEKIARALDEVKEKFFTPAALTASGALCAPLTPIYDLPGVETPARPVRDALPSFQANRGGVQVGATPLLGDFVDAITVITAAENEAGGTTAFKNCHIIPCPEFTSVKVDAISACYQMDNLGGRAFPELMSRVEELLRAEQARLADSKILTQIAAGSTTLSGGFTSPGAVVAFLGDVFAAAAQYRSSNRMSAGAVLQALFPEWLIDLLALDIASGQFDRFQTRDQIVTILRQAGIAPVFHLDGSATAADGQVFARATDGALDGFPASVEWFLFAPGTWLHLDSGQLDLGVVRDSILNSTNDFQNFSETWENVVKVGGDSYAITTDVCPSGEVVSPNAPAISCASD